MSDVFSYSNINRCEGGRLIIRHGDYEAFESALYGDHFIFLKDRTPRYLVISLKNHHRGYKLHISLDDSHSDGNLEEGWAILSAILMKHKVYFFNVIKNESRKFLTEQDIKGQAVTIYAFREKRTDWEIIIRELTYALSQNKIRPGLIADYDKTIPNSAYVSYCNDAISLLPDPFSGIKL